MFIELAFILYTKYISLSKFFLLKTMRKKFIMNNPSQWVLRKYAFTKKINIG